LGLGGWTTFGGSVKDQKTINDIIFSAFENGVNFFDIADIYAQGESEIVMGKAFRELNRSSLVISSKLFWPMSEEVNDRGLSRKHIMESVEKSLRRIGTDYLDIYFCHRYDTETQLEETVRAMDDLVRQGKILYWGTSEWTGAQLRDAHKIAREFRAYAPQVEQPQYNLLAREKFETDVRPTTDELGMGLVLWSPLSSGILTGKYDDGIPEDSRMARMGWLRESILTPENVRRAREMKKWADELDCTRAQLALAWAAAQPGVSSVILGATSLKQLQENLGANRVKISPKVDQELKALFR
jgi:voltage-dependent potassium channel beta subunit